PDSKSLIFEHYGKKFPNDCLLNIRDIGAAHDRGAFTGEPGRIVFSPDGTRIATGTTAPTHDKRNRAMLWAWAEGKAPVLLKDHEVGVDDLAFSQDLTCFATVTASKTVPDTMDIAIVDMNTGR